MTTIGVERQQSPARSLLRFFALTYAVTWTCFTAALAMSGHVPGAPAASLAQDAGPARNLRAFHGRPRAHRASIVLGLIWALWHVPLFYLPEADTYGQSFPVYLLQVTALSVAIAWLYWRTHGSLLLTMLMHAAINNTKDIVPAIPRTPTNPWAVSAALVAWLGLALLWIGATYFLIRMRNAQLAARPAR